MGVGRIDSEVFLRKFLETDLDCFVQKIRDRQLAAPIESETLQDLVRNELKTKSHTATEGLLWLVRYASPFRLLLSLFNLPAIPFQSQPH